MKLHIFESAPEGFLDLPCNELHRVLPGPSLIRFDGEKKPPLVLATLLHGNEPTGIQAIQTLINRYNKNGTALPRSLYVFVGNIEAAKNNVRRLPNQIDFNRIWKGGDLAEHRLADQVINFLKEIKPFASIDIHNTSGKNPHYACINHIKAPLINLGHQFSNTLVYFTRPAEVLSIALAGLCPSITIESGQPQDPHGVPHVLDFIEKCLKLDKISDEIDPQAYYKIFHTVAKILVPAESKIGFNGNSIDTDFSFIENLDLNNFKELQENTLLGWRHNPNLKLSVIDENDCEVESDFIFYRENEIRLKRAVTPSMLSTNAQSVHQDCLGYLMERHSLSP